MSSQQFHADHAQFESAIAERIKKLDSCGDSPLTWTDALRSLERSLARLKFAVEESDFLDAKRHVETLIALLHITARDRKILTDSSAVAETDSANG